MNNNTFKALAEAFTIFAKYEEGEYKTKADHDTIYSGPEPEKVSEEDKKRLEELGWEPSEGGEGFVRFV